MAALFERVVRSPLEFTFKDDDNGKYAQIVTKELEGKSNLLMDATYMPTSEDTRHRGRRDESFKDSAQTVASDEGHVWSEGTHENEYTVELGLIDDGCKFNSIQEGNAPSRDVVETERNDISRTIESINRKDAYLTVYGSQLADPKAWNGLAYYTRKVTNRSTFENKYYAGKNPFEGKDLCLTLDNQADATTTSNTKLSVTHGSIFSSIYAVVWGQNTVAKLYPKESSSYGIETDVSPESVVVVNNRWHKERYIAFRKSSGVNVANRFGLIRIANINMDKVVYAASDTSHSTPLTHDVKEEYERLCINMAFVEEILAKAGLAGGVKFYAPVPLIRKMREARALGNASQSNIYYSIPGVEQAGQIHGLMANEFYLNDNYLITPEFQMIHTEAFVS